MSNRNLMLSRDAAVDTEPQLEILADDVKCSHGTTVGQLDPNALFYLRARGIPLAQATRMMSRFARLAGFGAGAPDDGHAVEAVADPAPNPKHIDPETLREPIIDALRSVHDPEISVNIYDLGLIYRLKIVADGAVEIDMTLTAPACPVAGTLPVMVREAAEPVVGVTGAKVHLVRDPPWSPERMSEEARFELGMTYTARGHV